MSCERLQHLEATIYKFRPGEELMQLGGWEFGQYVDIDALVVQLLTREGGCPTLDGGEEWTRLVGLNLCMKEREVYLLTIPCWEWSPRTPWCARQRQQLHGLQVVLTR